jgi:copper oxidase (laccase) domain-containing protein
MSRSLAGVADCLPVQLQDAATQLPAVVHRAREPPGLLAHSICTRTLRRTDPARVCQRLEH